MAFIQNSRRIKKVTRMSKSDDDYKFTWFGNNRYICDVFSDMRKCDKSKNYSPMKGLIEEAQVMANRMESALSDQKDLKALQIELGKARKAYKKLEKEYKELQSNTEELRSQSDES